MFDAVVELIFGVTNQASFPAEKTGRAIEKVIGAASRTISRMQKVGRGAEPSKNLAVEELPEEVIVGSALHKKGANWGTTSAVAAVCNGLSCCLGKLLHLGITRSPNKSTLSYANEKRPAALFEALFWTALHHSGGVAAEVFSLRVQESGQFRR